MFCPRPSSIDARARAYQRLTAKAEAVAKTIEREKEKLVKLCRRFGVTPPKAEKTLRLEGIEKVLDASFGISTSYDQEVIEAIRIVLAKRKAMYIFWQLFESRVSYSPRAGAKDFLDALPAKYRSMLKGRFLAVVKTTDKKPTLNVRPRVVAESRKPRRRA
jgi:hypothetical protein